MASTPIYGFNTDIWLQHRCMASSAAVSFAAIGLVLVRWAIAGPARCARCSRARLRRVVSGPQVNLAALKSLIPGLGFQKEDLQRSLAQQKVMGAVRSATAARPAALARTLGTSCARLRTPIYPPRTGIPLINKQSRVQSRVVQRNSSRQVFYRCSSH
jgi:hypothetical protein